MLLNYEGKACKTNLLVLRHGVSSLGASSLTGEQHDSQINKYSLAGSSATYSMMSHQVLSYQCCATCDFTGKGIGIQPIVTNLEGQDLSRYNFFAVAQ